MTAHTQYLLKSKSGSPLLAFNNLSRAREVLQERNARGLGLRLFRVVRTEEELS